MCNTTKDCRAPGAISRLPGERWADFDARQRQHRIDNSPAKPKRKRVSRAKAKVRGAETYETRADDIGLSPDF